jgi:hypothetical protein
MKSLWFQLLLWFCVTFIAVSAAFLLVDNRSAEVTAPDTRTTAQAGTSHTLGNAAHPVDEGRSANSRSTVRLQSAYGLAMLLAFAVVAFIVAGKLVAPLRSVNTQLDLITPRTLARKVWVQQDATIFDYTTFAVMWYVFGARCRSCTGG